MNLQLLCPTHPTEPSGKHIGNGTQFSELTELVLPPSTFPTTLVPQHKLVTEGQPTISVSTGHFYSCKAMLTHSNPIGTKSASKRKQEFALYHHLLENKETPEPINLQNC